MGESKSTWRAKIAASVRAALAAKARRPRPTLKGKAYAGNVMGMLCAARGGKDLY